MIDQGALMRRLWWMPRSITGAAVRETFDILECHIPLHRVSVPSGTKVYDWTVPPEWNVQSARLTGPDGVVCDWEDNFLHLVGYSVPTDTKIQRRELVRDHVYAADDAIPYVTSYYKRHWGFCLPKQQLATGTYHARIDATLDEHGQLDYADLVIPGESKEEVMFSTYCCHPNMANDNTTGMVVLTALAEWLLNRRNKYTYRMVWVPETIGALCYLREHLYHLQRNLLAGFVVSNLGREVGPSVVHSRPRDTKADKLADALGPTYSYTWMARGSDERQYGSPLADLPVVHLSSLLYSNYPEYHTSADTPDLVSDTALTQSLAMLQRIVLLAEADGYPMACHVGDAQLGDRGMYPTLSHGTRDKSYQHVLSYCDGRHDVLDIAAKVGQTPDDVAERLRQLTEHELVRWLP